MVLQMRQVTSLLLLSLSIFSFNAFGQDRYMIFFKDKANSQYSINRPEEFLSDRAIQRRSKQNISVTAQDLPVSQSYISQVADLGIETYYPTRWMNGVLVQMETELVNTVSGLSFVDRVEYVGPGAILSLPSGERAKFEEDPISLSGISHRQFEMIGLDQMHREGFWGEGVIVAIFDDGFQNYKNIPAFQHILDENRIIYTHDFSKNRSNVENGFNHGLRVFSLLGASSEELTGGAPKASYILSVTEAPGEYRVEEYNWLFAAERADSSGVDVINTSLAYNEFSDPSMSYLPSDMDGQTAVITRAANLASERGIVVVVSTGNTGSTAWRIIAAPADSEDVLAVGAVNDVGQVSNFSGMGPSSDNRIKPDVMAMGVNTRLINVNGSVSFQSGTSFSAPLVAGLATGLLQAFPDLTGDEIDNVIRKSADRYSSPDEFYGYGIPSFLKAAEIASRQVPGSNDIMAFPNPTNLNYFTLTFSDEYIGQNTEFQLINGDGGLVMNYNIQPTLFNNKFQIDLSKAKTGLLLIRLITESGVIVKKIIKTQ